MLLSLVNYWTPDKYSLNLKVLGDRPNFRGSCAIELKRGSNDFTTTFKLNATKIIITKAVLYEGDCEIATLRAQRETKYVSFEFPEETKDSQQLRLELDYLAVQTKITNMATPTTGMFKFPNSIWATHCQPGWASSIFPCVDEPSVRCKIQLTVATDDPGYTCISNMPLRDTLKSAEACEFIFEESLPMPTHLFALVMGKLQRLSSEEGKIQVSVYAEDTTGFECAFATAVKCTNQIESLLKLNYPVPKIDIVALPFLSDGAMENWSLITVAGEHIKYTSGDAESDWNATKNVREIVAHELVHQWLGNLCSFRSWDNTWFNESFATWMANRVLASIDGTGLWESHLNIDLIRLLNIDSHVQNIPVIGNHKTNETPSYIAETFDPKTYTKGIYLLEMLSSFIGFEAFCEAVGQFILANQCKSITVLDLWLYLRQATAFDIPTVVNSWLRNKGFPVIEVSIEGNMCKIEQHRYLDVQRIQDTDEEDIPFHIPLILHSNGQQTKKVLTDRKIVLDVIPDSVTAPKLALLRYNNVEFASKLNGDQVFKYCFDFDFSTEIYKDKVDFFILKQLGTQLKLNSREGYKYLQVVMELINSMSVISTTEDKAFIKKWIKSLNLQFNMDNIELTEAKRTSFEVNAISGMLKLSIGENVKQLVGLFDKVLKGDVNLPLCYASLSFVAVAMYGDSKQFERLLSLTEDDNALLKVLGSVQLEGKPKSDILSTLTTQIVQSLGFSRSTDNLRKLLAHILARLKKGKEDQYHLCFEQLPSGLSSTSECRRMVWEWFRTNYKALAKNGEKSKDFQLLVKSCFSCCVFEKTTEMGKELSNFMKKNDSVVLKRCLEASKAELESHERLYELSKTAFCT